MTPTPGDTTAPGPVTGLSAVATTTTDVQVRLSWTKPTDADFTGVMIRRSLGGVAPATVSAGDLVVTDTPQTSYINSSGLAPGTQYSYAVFAHDGVPNHSVGANVTVTTKAFPVTTTGAVLTVNVLGFPNNKVTVNELATFDASESHPAAGTTLASGTLDYGDGVTEPLTGPVSSWNTSHSYATTGPKSVKLTVTDSAGTTDTATATVTVVDAPATGTATISITNGPATVGVPVTFALNASTPAGTVLTSYELIFTGPEVFNEFVGTAPPATHDVTFTFSGTYKVVFRVENDAVGSTFAELDFVVAP